MAVSLCTIRRQMGTRQLPNNKTGERGRDGLCLKLCDGHMKKTRKNTKSNNELTWNKDLIEKLRTDLIKRVKGIYIEKGKILRDIFIVHEDENYKLQLGFFDQDIIIYTKTMDISMFKEVKNIKIHNIDKNNETIYIPRIICELKYDGINTHGLITYSDIASNVKSIFPLCKYILILRYRGNSSPNKLLRNGKTFDKILCLDDVGT